MNRVEISTLRPVTENFCRVSVSDPYASGDFLVDNLTMKAAVATGQRAVLSLICARSDGISSDILLAAVLNYSEVHLDGADVDLESLANGMNMTGRPAVAA